MKTHSMILTLALLISTTLTATAYAYTTTCTNADRSLSFSHRTSSGGAQLDVTLLTYKGQTQRNSNRNEPGIAWRMSEQKELSQQSSNGTTTIDFVGLSTGQVHGKDQVLTFSEWVICQQVIPPACHLCP